MKIASTLMKAIQKNAAHKKCFNIAFIIKWYLFSKHASY